MRVLNQAENQSDQFAVRYCRTAAIAKVKRCIDLNTQAARLVIVFRVLDAGDDSLRYRQFCAAGRLAVDIDRVFNPR